MGGRGNPESVVLSALSIFTHGPKIEIAAAGNDISIPIPYTFKLF
jgi:hypothetical protein